MPRVILIISKFLEHTLCNLCAAADLRLAKIALRISVFTFIYKLTEICFLICHYMWC